ncbi:hypothetical protein BC831DRAFT_443405 [Entophlyctis helioformis]|nr:hypothetical protein BC831DRAFT_443405 [Entophlyctis helioformis]
MSSDDFHVQLFATTIAAASIGLFPPIKSYYIHKNKSYESMGTSERRVTTLILVGVSLMHVSEAFKSVAFGLQFYQRDKFLGFIPMALFFVGSLWLVEIARILLFSAVAMRTAQFLMRPQDPPATRSRRVMWVYAVNGIHIAWPILMSGKIAPSLFGAFAAAVLFGDAILYGVLGIAIYMRVVERKRKELLPAISNFVLYSNSLALGAIAALSLLLGGIMASNANGGMGSTNAAQAFIEILPSVYAITISTLLCFSYWDIKEILVANSPTGASPRRIGGPSTGLGRNVFTF